MRKLRFGFAVGAAALFVAASVAAAESNAASGGKPWALDETNSLRLSYEEFQQQQQVTLHALEQVRQEAESAAKRNAETLDARLNQLQSALAAQRERELDTLRSSHQFTLIIVAVCAGIGFCGLLAIVLFLVRAIIRRPELGIPIPMGTYVGHGSTMTPGSGETQLVALDPAQQLSARFLRTIERLEKRIQELETGADVPEPDIKSVPVVKLQPEPISPAPAPAPEAVGSAAPRPNADRAARVALLLGKGQSLLHLQQTDTALACFDEVIALDPTNAEAFVKKGTALEKLGQLDEAIDCYDRAIALDTSMTMAYLCKGGVFNRLERYSEALQCYEQALRAQQKVGVA